MDGLIKSMCAPCDWEDRASLLRVENAGTRNPQEYSETDTAPLLRVFLEEDQFVDALATFGEMNETSFDEKRQETQLD